MSTGLTQAKTGLARIDEIAKECNIAGVTSHGFAAQLAVARAMGELRSLLTADVMRQIMALQGSELGFLTDQDKKGGYDEKTVRDVAIVAILRGFALVNNEINIIAGRCYGTKNGYTRLVRELPGLTDLKVTEGRIVKQSDAVAIVPVVAEWLVNGKRDEIKADIPVKIDGYSTADQILGKAWRKIHARIYARVTGSRQSDVDDEQEDEVVAATSGALASPASNQTKPDAWQTYVDSIAAATTINECELRYEQSFSPTQNVGWTTEEDAAACSLRESRKEEIRSAIAKS